MMIGEERYEWIENYLQGNLNKGGKIKFEQQLKTDAGLKEELHLHQQANSIIFDQGLLDLKKDLRDFSNSHKKAQKRNKKTRNVRNIIITASAIAVATLVSLLVVHNQAEKNVDVEQNPTKTEVSKKTAAVEKANTKPTTKDPAPVTNQNASRRNTRVMDGNTQETKEETRRLQDSSEVSEPDLFLNVNDTIEKPEPVKTETADLQTTENNNNEQNEPTTVDCEAISFSAKVTSKNSCIEEVNGRIEIRYSSVEGGKAPYLFAINNGNFKNSTYFPYLEAGNYEIYIKDANQCEKLLETIKIDAKFCKKEFVIAPHLGETWKIPMHNYDGGTIKIYNKTGFQVYENKLNGFNDNEWNGTTTDSNPLPMGVYKFAIKYNNGTTYTGLITIVK